MMVDFLMVAAFAVGYCLFAIHKVIRRRRVFRYPVLRCSTSGLFGNER